MVWQFQGKLVGPADSLEAYAINVYVDGGAYIDMVADTSSFPAITVGSAAGQTTPFLELKNSASESLFTIGADGLPIINSPDGTRYRIVVADGGALSTEEVT